MSLIDPNLFKDGGAAEAGGAPFASPYSAPKPDAAPFKDLRGLSKVLIGFLALDVVLNAVFLLILIPGMAAPDIVYGDNLTYELMGGLATAITVIWFVRLAVMLVWFYRATKNARSVSGGMETTPGWAVGYFFVPVLSLFRPYRTISEIWRSATEPLSWRSQSDSPLLGWWWGLYLASGLIPVLARLIEGETAGLLTVVSIAAGIAENVIFFLIVRYVARRQWENRNESVFD